MITLRRSGERGHAEHGWLDSRHTFSFANYYDPRFMGVSDLRVINDDWVSPGAGFDTHPHRDMEIISYVLKGSIEHRDTMDNHRRLNAGELQVMSAGSGVRHSEYNPSPDERLNFLQIWIRPDRNGEEPRYAQKDFSDSRGITLMVSPDGQERSLPIRQDAYIYKVSLDQSSAESASLTFAARAGRMYYLHLARGTLSVNGTPMIAGDGATIRGQSSINFTSPASAEALLIDLRVQ